ncbi:MAG: ribokinase [Clostridia bacterium]|nr:ribokinase [Clostridia bacterium]
MGRKIRIAVAGSMIFDFVASADRLPKTGETVIGNSFGMFSGGKGANQAVQAAKLGAEVYMIGRVGDDFLGERLMEGLKKTGVITDYIKKDPTSHTAACCIHVDANGDNAIIIAPEANMSVTADDIRSAGEVIQSADIFISQLEIAMPAVEYAVGLASEHGVPVVLNPAPHRAVSKELFKRADVVTPNETEAEFYTGIPMEKSNIEECAAANAEKLMAMGAKSVVITLGKKGAFLAYEGIRKRIDTPYVVPVDTTAAGDAFNGALAVALAEGRSMEQAVVFANGAGALAASKAGAQSSICDRAQLEAFLEKSGLSL